MVLNETSKTLEKRDVNNSKLLQDNFEFLRQEILSKNKLINYLMEKQTTTPNLVTSAKNQEKIQEIYKILMFHNNNNNIYKVNIYNNIFYTNTILVKINYILSMELFKQTFEHKIAKNLTPRIH